MDEKTSKKVGKWAAIGAKDPTKLSNDQVQAVCASALTQRPNRPSSGIKLRADVTDEILAIEKALATIERLLQARE